MKKKSAFTLIELLVVVAIIAILAALLFPSLASFMERGKATDCANNLRGLGQVLNQYLSDTKGTFFSNDSSGDETWPKVLKRNYVKDWRPFRSPFDKPTTARPKSTENDPIPVSYGINEKLFDTYNAKWKSPPTSLIVAACAIDLTADGKEIKFKSDAFATANVKLIAPGGDGKQMEKGLGTHQNRQSINVLKSDGSVESSMQYHKFADSTTERGKQQWDPLYEPTTTP
jgi:prepilin-type N-terminal cleavage/methylation domain-containing protein